MQKAKQARKRILSVTLKRMVDDSPDTSYLGEYGNRQTSKFSIDRAHSEDCASLEHNHREAVDKLERVIKHVNGSRETAIDTYGYESQEVSNLDETLDTLSELQDSLMECDCGECGDMERHEYRYFNPSFNYITKSDEPADGLTAEDVRKYVRQDYDSMERLNRGDWCYLGIMAEAKVILNLQTGGPSKWHGVTHKITSGGLWGIASNSERSHIEETEKDELANLRDELLAAGFSRRAIAQAFKDVQEVDS